MEKVTAYKTSDGKLYEDFDKADWRQAVLDVEVELNKEKLMGNYEGSYVGPISLVEWIVEHADLVTRLLKR